MKAKAENSEGWSDQPLIAPVAASIEVRAADATESASSEYLTLLACAGAALARNAPSSGIVDLPGVTVTPVMATAAAVSGATSRRSTPRAIARPTAWLPAVRCSESTTSSAAGIPAGSGVGVAVTGWGAAVWCFTARLYSRYTRTATIRSSPSRGDPRPSRLDVATHSVPSGAATTVRMRP